MPQLWAGWPLLLRLPQTSHGQLSLQQWRKWKQRSQRQSQWWWWWQKLRVVPPGPSDPPTKPFWGKTFHWCAKCCRWSTTHSTNTHVGQGKDGAPDPSAQLALDPFAWQPLAWLADFASATAHESWDLFGTHLVHLLVGCFVTLVFLYAPLILFAIWETLSPFGWAVVGPLLWLVLLALILGMKWVCPPTPPDPEPIGTLRRVAPTIWNMHITSLILLICASGDISLVKPPMSTCRPLDVTSRTSTIRHPR